MPLSLAPPATFSVFTTVVADPSWLWRARADFRSLSSGFWDLAPPASRFRALVRPRLGLGTKGRFDPRTVSALGFSSFRYRVRRTPAHHFWVPSARGLCLRGGRRFCAMRDVLSPRRATDSAERREGALQRFNEFDGLSGPAMFSVGSVCLYEVLHRPRNARRSLFAGQRSPAVTSGATCLEMSFT